MCFPETVTVNLKAVNWLKEKYPELCVTAGLCERIGGMLYTKTHYTTPPQSEARGLSQQQRTAAVGEDTRRAWVGLDEEDDIDWEEGGSLRDLVEAVEAKLKEKNT